MLQRFVEQARETSDDSWTGNFETNQTIRESNSQNTSLVLQAGSKTSAFDNRSPERPGFFTVLNNGKTQIEGAAHFADTREADFKDAQPINTLEALRFKTALRQSEADPWTPLWLLGALGCLIIAWAWKAPRLQTVAAETAIRAA